MDILQSFVRPIQIRWADLDPNFHLRHSVYYDYGAYCRIGFFEEFVQRFVAVVGREADFDVVEGVRERLQPSGRAEHEPAHVRRLVEDDFHVA